LSAFQRQIEEFHQRGATLVLVSPAMPDQSLSMVEKENLTYDVLSDVGNQTAREYGLVFSLEEKVQEIYKGLGINVPEFNGDDSWELPVPATYVIDKSGSVVWSFVDVNHTVRAEPADIFAALDKLKPAA